MNYDAFLLTFDTTQVSQEELIQTIDGIAEIANWYAVLPATIFVVSHLPVRDISRIVRLRWPDLRFILVRLHKGERQGWLPTSAWKFISNPRPPDKLHTAAE